MCYSCTLIIVKKKFSIILISTTALQKSDWLLKGKVKEYPLDKCKEKLFSTAQVTIEDSQFCATSDKGIDVCRGDSGGPLFYKQNDIFYLQAITSFGTSCGESFPAIYTRVTKFLDWIEDEMSTM